MRALSILMQHSAKELDRSFGVASTVKLEMSSVLTSVLQQLVLMGAVLLMQPVSSVHKREVSICVNDAMSEILPVGRQPLSKLLKYHGIIRRRGDPPLVTST